MTYRIPDSWICIEYKDGRTETVGNAEGLTVEEARQYKKQYGRKVVAVSLRDSNQKLLKRVVFR